MGNINTCTSCACGIANDDWTHLDYHHEHPESDEVMASIQATLEAVGWLTHVERKDFGGYFDCYICNEVCIGEGDVFETTN